MDQAITLQLTIPGGASRVDSARNTLAVEELLSEFREKLANVSASLVEVSGAAIANDARGRFVRTEEQRRRHSVAMRLAWQRRRSNGHQQHAA